MRLLLTAFALFCLFRLSFAAPVDDKKAKPDDKKPEKPDTRPIVVDFSPVIGDKDPTISLTIHFENGTKLDDLTSETSGGIVKNAESIALAYEAQLSPKFDVIALKGEPKLLIRGYKGKGVLEVRCVAVGLPCENQPKVSRLKEEKKDKK
jgi:hypothetical protein